MELIHSVEKMQTRAHELKRAGKSIALVPTMGAFHEGHLSLMREGRKSADVLLVSLFVNPAQFGQDEDFERYPRTLEHDRQLAKEIGVDIIFAPHDEDMYPSGYKTYVTVESMSRNLCGISRPTHFRGVTTIVLKLLNIAQPDVAFFGWKDAQQFLILKKMVEDLNLPVKMAGLPIVREPDGLAMSSRNRYLNPEERKDALSLYKALQVVESLIEKGEDNCETLKNKMKKIITGEPTARIDYIEIVSMTTLEPITRIEKGNTLIALAVYTGATRLIDNIRV